MIQIFTDTSANLPAAYIQKYSLRVIPLTYFVDGAEAHQDPVWCLHRSPYQIILIRL